MFTDLGDTAGAGLSDLAVVWNEGDEWLQGWLRCQFFLLGGGLCDPLVNLCHCLGPHRAGDVGVDVQRGGRRHVAQHSGESLHIHAAGEGHRGKSMPKIMNAYAETKLKPQIEVSSNAFKITLPNRNTGENHAETLVGTVKGDEQRILDFIGSQGHIVRSDVDRLLDVSQATANRILKHMVAEGLIYQDGNGRKTKYRRK